jgi:D-sedoheptulose 7-phosphate isomerase
MTELRIDFSHALAESQRAFQSVVEQPELVNGVAQAVVDSLDNGGKVIWLGNGGSAADAQHMAAELMVRYVKNRRPLASLALTTDSSILTAHSNDYEFETAFARQIEGLAKPGDIVIAMSTSGQSENIIRALQQAKNMSCVCVALTGSKDNQLVKLADFSMQVDSEETARIQEAHSFFNHLLCEALDQAYA